MVKMKLKSRPTKIEKQQSEKTVKTEVEKTEAELESLENSAVVESDVNNPSKADTTPCTEEANISTKQQSIQEEFCSKEFSSSEALVKHKTSQENDQTDSSQQQTETPQRIFPCAQCDKSFKELRTLRLHLKIHNAEYPERCLVCHKAFRTKWQLKQHQMDHGGERPYPCPECSFTCKTKQQLNEHRRKHSGEKAYSCHQCSTRFTYRNGLIKHTKLNRCPKKVLTPDGETIIKKRTRSNGTAKVKTPKGQSSSNHSNTTTTTKRIKSRTIEESGMVEEGQTISSRSEDGANELNANEQSSFDNNGNFNKQDFDNSTYSHRTKLLDHKSLTTNQFSLLPNHHSETQQHLLSATAILQLSAATGLSAAKIQNWAGNLPPGSTIQITRHYENHSNIPQKQETYQIRNSQYDSPQLPRSQLLNPNDKLAVTGALPSYLEAFAVDPNKILRKDIENRSCTGFFIKTEPMVIEDFDYSTPEEAPMTCYSNQQWIKCEPDSPMSSSGSSASLASLASSSVGESPTAEYAFSPLSSYSKISMNALMMSSSCSKGRNLHDPSPSNKNLLDSVVMSEAVSRNEQNSLNMVQDMSVRYNADMPNIEERNVDLMADVSNADDQDLISGFNLNDQDFHSMKTIVEQTFRDGRDMLDIISTV